MPVSSRLQKCLLAGLLTGLPPLLGQAVTEPPAQGLVVDGFQVQAYAGSPYGVCLIQPLTPPARPATRGTLADLEAERRGLPGAPTGRMLYPAYEDGGTAFLFKGSAPLELSLGPSGPRRIPVALDSPTHPTALEVWWKAYLAQAARVVAQDAYEPVAETYLLSMLSRRLNLDARELNYWRPWSSGSTDDVLGYLLGTESIRLAMQNHVFLDTRETKDAPMVPLPAATAPPPVAVPAFDEKAVEIEPMAWRVPKECFYLRSASFQDFLWLRRLLDVWGGEFRNLLATRGADYGIRARLERQLALHETALSRQFGDLVVGEVALIGTDTFFREGSAVGLLFKAKRSSTLGDHLQAQRQKRRKEDATIHESTERIAGREVSLLSSPGHAVRSFYVVDGDFHLVTNSRWIAERFLNTARDRDLALGSLEEFRFARSRMPASRRDPAFLYLSDPFFRSLVGPAYRVEMTRRAASQAELSVLALARLAAKGEGSPASDLPQLIEAGYLPADFGSHADGSRLLTQGGLDVDSARGARGSFLPVPDGAPERITQAEAEAYKRFTAAYARLWTRMDPVFGAITKKDLPDGRQQVALDLHISPYVKAKYGPLEGFLGAPGAMGLAPVAGNLLSAEVVLKARLRSRDDEAEAEPRRDAKEAHRLFGGVRDFSLPFSIREAEVLNRDGRHQVKDTFDHIHGYVGEFKGGQEVLLRSLGVTTDRGADAKGYSQLKEPGRGDSFPEGLWGRHFGEFVILGTGRSLLEVVSPQLKLQKAERPAQLRLQWGDLAKSGLAPFLTAQLYTRDRRTSTGNALFLETLIRQLGVAPTEALATAEQLLDQRLVCPLGGSYVSSPKEPSRWVSTAWSADNLRQVDQVPAKYHAASLEWLHGAALEFTLGPDFLQTRLELSLDPKKQPKAEAKRP